MSPSAGCHKRLQRRTSKIGNQGRELLTCWKLWRLPQRIEAETLRQARNLQEITYGLLLNTFVVQSHPNCLLEPVEASSAVDFWQNTTSESA